MADDLSTTGSIAIFLLDQYPGVSAGVSGNMVIMVDMARQHVANYTQKTIGSNNINDAFQPAIVDFARADVIDLLNQDGNNLKLAELSLGEDLTSEQYRKLGEMKLRDIGKGFQFAQALS